MTRNEKISYLKKKLEQLKANETQIGKDELKTRYAVSYKKLRSEICTIFNQLLTEQMNGTRIPIKEIDLADLESAMGTFRKEYTDALFVEYDADKALAVVEEMRMVLFFNFHAILSFYFEEDEAPSGDSQEIKEPEAEAAIVK